MRTILLALITLLVFNLVNAQWSADPAINAQITISISEQAIPKVVLGPTGDYYVGYFSNENGNYNVRLQRLDNTGKILWDENGLLISDHPSMSWLTDWDMTVDQENHAILTWQDIRESGNNNTVAYRISPEGDFVWGEDGIMLSSSTSFDVSPKVAITGSNNAVFAWQSQSVIIIQKITPEGTKQWGDWGITLSGANTFSWPQLLPVGDDEVLLKYFNDSGPSWSPNRNIFVQRFNSNGQPVWDNPANAFNGNTIQAWHQILPFKDDGNDGAYLAWHDYSQSATQSSSKLQHISANGEILLGEAGLLLSDRNNFNQFDPRIAQPDNDENIYIYWREVNGDQNQWGIYGQKVSTTGERLWEEMGREIVPVSSQYVYPWHADDVGDDIMVFYEFGLSPTTSEIRAMRLDKEGGFVWENDYAVITSAPTNKGKTVYSGFDGNQWAVIWEDDRNGNVDLYGQNFRGDGTLGNPAEYQLNITIEGEGSVLVDGVLYNTTLTILEETIVTVSAQPQAGWVFAGWSGDLESYLIDTEFIMDGDKNITATFAPTTYQLSIVSNPAEGGTTMGAGEYTVGETATVTAAPNDGYGFQHWTLLGHEAILSTIETFDYTMPGDDITLEAHFQFVENVNEFSAAEISIFPNPTNGWLFINTTVDVKSIEIFDMAGKSFEIKGNLQSNSIHFDTSGFPKGIYFLKIMDVDRVGIFKLLIE